MGLSVRAHSSSSIHWRGCQLSLATSVKTASIVPVPSSIAVYLILGFVQNVLVLTFHPLVSLDATSSPEDKALSHDDLLYCSSFTRQSLKLYPDNLRQLIQNGASSCMSTSASRTSTRFVGRLSRRRSGWPGRTKALASYRSTSGYTAPTC